MSRKTIEIASIGDLYVYVELTESGTDLVIGTEQGTCYLPDATRWASKIVSAVVALRCQAKLPKSEQTKWVE